MSGAKGFHLAQKMAIVALAAAPLAVANPGLLPAQAAYGQAAYAPPAPPPSAPSAPGGYIAVITSQTIDPAGGVIGPVRIHGLLVSLTIRPGTFSSGVQITLTAPLVRAAGDAGHPGQPAIGGVGVLIEVGGKLYTGAFSHPLILHISGTGITARTRVAVSTRTGFVIAGSAARRHTLRTSFKRSDEDFAVLTPTGFHYAGQPTGTAREQATALTRGRNVAGEAVLASLFISPPHASPAGIGVLAPEWLAAHSH